MSKETKVNMDKDNEIQSLQAEAPIRSQNAFLGDVNFARSTIAEKVKSLSPSLAGEPVKRSSLEKTPRNIKKMISVFESSISQDRVPLKPLSTKSYRAGSLRLLKDTAVKDYYDISESSQDKLKVSETSSSTRLRNSFSTGDLRKTISSITTKEEQVSFDSDFAEPSETNGAISVNNEEKAHVIETDTEKDGIDAHGEPRMSFKSDCKIPAIVVKGDGIGKQGEEMVCVSENSSPKSGDEEASNGALGQAIKIALVVGFGVLVLLFRQREPRRAKKKENTRALKNQVFMNKQRSVEEQRRRIGVMRSS